MRRYTDMTQPEALAGASAAVSTRCSGSVADPCQDIAAALAGRGWCVCTDFLSPELVSGLYDEARELWQGGEFRHARVGHGRALQLRPEARSDWVHWLQPGQASPPQQQYLARLEALRVALNRALFLGLFEYEGHLAVYPPGTSYQRHLDRFVDAGARTVSCVLYLNPDWCAEDGGQLRIYTEPGNDACYEDIVPCGGTLVTFLSEQFPHEVLQATRQRFSLTGWMKRRG